MTFQEYQEAAMKTAHYPRMTQWRDGWAAPRRHLGFLYPALALNGEAGEVAEKVKKIWRDAGGIMIADDEWDIAKELGDVLWYIASCAWECGITLEFVAEQNLLKLHGRTERGTLSGEGDNR